MVKVYSLPLWLVVVELVKGLEFVDERGQLVPEPWIGQDGAK